MKKLLLCLLIGTTTLSSYEPKPQEKFVQFGENVKFTPAQRQRIIDLCNHSILSALRLLDELADMNWYIPKRSLRDIAADAISGAIGAAQTRDAKSVVFNSVFNVVQELSKITWSQFCEYRDKVEAAETHYDNYLFYLKLLQNDT